MRETIKAGTFELKSEKEMNTFLKKMRETIKLENERETNTFILRQCEPIKAYQWFKNGDHPNDNCEIFDAGDGPFQGEGKVVRYYRHPDVDEMESCECCGNIMHLHGWIEDGNNGDGYIVCPGNWILRDKISNEYYPCSDRVFNQLYEKVEEEEE